MKQLGLFSFVFLFLSICQSLYCQNSDIREIIEDLTENIVSEEGNKSSAEEIFEDLFFFSENKLNLNDATEAKLNDLHLLNSFQIQSLLDYISVNGALQSIYELQVVFGFDKELVRKLRIFTEVSPVNENRGRSIIDLKPGQIVNYGSHQLLVKAERILEKRRGYLNREDGDKNLFLGDPYKLYTQYKFNLNRRLFLGFTAEKDPGEEFLSGSNYYGFDYHSFHFLYQGEKWLKNLALGDYSINFGQGLTAWSGFSFDKSPYVLSVMRKGDPIKKYTSSDENRFFRGAACTFLHDNFEYSAFYSSKNIDANFTGQKNEVPFFSSFRTTGYHRIPREIDNERILNEKVMGANILFRDDHFELGLSGVYATFGGDIEKSFKPYKLYQFSGNENFVLGLDYKYSFKQFFLFGEFAYSDFCHAAWLSGLQAQLTEKLGIAMVYRNYHRAYKALYADPFSESSTFPNEKGLYMGLNLELFSWLIGSVSFDSYQHTWITYLTDSPSEGWSSLVNLNFPVYSDFEFYIRYQYSEEEVNYQESQSLLPGLMYENKYKIRLNVKYDISEFLKLQNRISFTECFLSNDTYEQGILICQDFSWRLKKLPLELDFRYGIFDTDSYQSSLYSYEQDLLYNFSIPAYYSKGFRYYINVKYNYEPVTFYLKLGRFYYTDKNSIGSGLNMIDGNTKTSLKMQLRIKW
jgi:hypothetical protein